MPLYPPRRMVEHPDMNREGCWSIPIICTLTVEGGKEYYATLAQLVEQLICNQ